MPKKAKTWIVVADGGRARVLAARGPRRGLDLVLEREAHAPRTSELGTDRPGRSFESATSARHAYNVPDYHREREQAFLRDLVRELTAEHKAGRFERLILVAPPTALGDLRKALGGTLGGTLGAAVTAEINKDLTKVALHDLPAHLSDVAPC
ncbi:MAG: host attachment protein [Alphaproteobacteria bacterium]